MLDGSTANGTAVENGTSSAPNSDQAAATSTGANVQEYDYTIQNNGATVGTVYYFRAYDYGASDASGSATNLNAIFRSQIKNTAGTEQTSCTANGSAAVCTYPSVLSNQTAPSAPVISRPTNGAINVPAAPAFDLSSSDAEGDYVQYLIEVCPTNSWPCASGGTIYCMSASDCSGGSQSDWTGQDANSGTAYKAKADINNSTLATYTVPSLGYYQPNTTYYIRAKAKDPGGTNTFGSYSSTYSFTISASPTVQIRGGSTINGGTQIGGSL